MSEPVTLFMMRHGAPAIEGRLLGRTDCDVTEPGVASCVAQAATLAFAQVISSDLQRAVRCAAAIAGAHGLRSEPDRRWRELDFGAWDGLPASAIDADALGNFWADPDGAPPPGGESWSALRSRIEAAIAGLPPVPALVVSHGGAIRAALAVLCGFEPQQGWAFDLPYASVVTVRWWPEAPRCGQITALRS